MSRGSTEREYLPMQRVGSKKGWLPSAGGCVILLVATAIGIVVSIWCSDAFHRALHHYSPPGP